MPIFNYIYPATPELQQKVPLWLKFFCYEYSSNSLYRSNALASSGIPPAGLPMLGSVMIPAPTEFSTYANASYATAINSPKTKTKADPRQTLSNMASSVGNLFGARMDANEDGLLDMIEGIAMKFNNGPFGLGNLVNMDMSDTTFQGMNKRMYQFKILLASITEQDAAVASQISEFFQAFQLPTAVPGVFSKIVRHPSLWYFGIGPGNNPNFDSDWCGQPQFSLLNNCTVNKAGFKNMFAVSDGGRLKPLAQSISLSFVELEPVLSAAFSTTIVSRSTSFYSLGGIGAGAARAAGSIIGG